jgi:hypothetical protein
MSKYEMSFHEPIALKNSKELWNNGSLIAFTAVLPLILDRFKAANVWDTMQLIQEVFTLELPSAPEMEAIIANETQQSQLIILNREAKSSARKALHPEWNENEVIIEDADTDEFILQRQISLSETVRKIRANFYMDMKHYQSELRRFNEDRAKALSVWNETFGIVSRKIAEPHILKYDFMQGLAAIEDYFAGLVTMDNSNILNHITTIVYNSKKESFEQFVDKFEILWQQLENMGNPQSDQNKINHLVTAIKRSTKDYDLTMQIAQRSRCTLSELKRDLHAREVELRTESYSKIFNNRNNNSNGKIKNGNAKRSNNNGNKSNKMSEQANACFKCGSEKHVFKNCPQLTKRVRHGLYDGHEKNSTKLIVDNSNSNQSNASNNYNNNNRQLKVIGNPEIPKKIRYESNTGNNNSSKAPYDNNHNNPNLVSIFRKNSNNSNSNSNNNMNEYYEESNEDEYANMCTTSIEYVNVLVDLPSDVEDSIEFANLIRSQRRIILDSGASSHMFNDGFEYENFVNKRNKIMYANGKNYSISTGYGTIGILNKVLCVPDLKENLISIGSLMSNGYTVSFEGTSAKVIDKDNKVVIKASLEDKLYCVSNDNDLYEYCNIISEGSAPKQPRSSTIGKTILETLHSRWGHLSEGRIKQAIKNKMVIGANVEYDQIKDKYMRLCETCMKGRIHRSKYLSSNTDHSKQKPFEITAGDIKGPFPIVSSRGHKYFIAMYCTSTGYTCLFNIASLRFTLDTLKEFNQVVRLANHTWSIFQTDVDSRFISEKVTAWCNEHNIQVRTSAPYSHQQNGAIERRIQHIMDRMITVMNEYSCPRKYWNYAADYVMYMINRSPTILSSDKTPYELVYKEKPDISIFVPFYCKGIYHVTKDERGLLDNRGIECRMVGYAPNTKDTYLILLKNGSVLMRRDVVWNYNNYEKDHSEEDVTLDNLFGMDERKKLDLDFPYWTPEMEIDEEEVIGLQIHKANANIELPKIPINIQDALNSEYAQQWKEAIEKELTALDDRKTFAIASQHGRAMKSRMLLKVSFDNNYNLKFKARLVACGYSQIYGTDYKETYSPTTTFSSLLLILILCGCENMFLSGLDVTNAYIESSNDYKNYLRLPKDLDPNCTRYEVVGALYGEKQAGKCWSERLVHILSNLDFERLISDPCVYKRLINEIIIIIVIYVDDILIISNNMDSIIGFKQNILNYVLAIKDLGDVEKYLGVRINRCKAESSIQLNQSEYINEFCNKFLSGDVIKNRTSPMDTIVKYRTLPKDLGNESILPIIGKARYAADKTRPDILLACSILASNAQNPDDLTVKASTRLLEYLKSTISINLVLGGSDKNLKLFGFVDASIDMGGDSRPQIGLCFYANKTSGSFYAMSKKGTCVVSSSTEGEVYGIEMFCKINENIRLKWQELSDLYTEPTILYVDSQSAMMLTETLKQSSKVKHFNLRINYIREQINNRNVKLVYINTKLNVADALTKPLVGATFTEHRRKLLEGFNGNDPTIE